MKILANSKEVLIDGEDDLIFSKTPKYKGWALKIKIKYLITAIKYIFSM